MSDALAELHRLEKETRALVRAQRALHAYGHLRGQGQDFQEELAVLNVMIARFREEYFHVKRAITWKRLENFDGFWLNQNGLIEHRRLSDLEANVEDRVVEGSKVSNEPYLEYTIRYWGDNHRITVFEETDEEGWPKVAVS